VLRHIARVRDRELLAFITQIALALGVLTVQGFAEEWDNVADDDGEPTN
jgi:hypothetical protein